VDTGLWLRLVQYERKEGLPLKIAEQQISRIKNKSGCKCYWIQYDIMLRQRALSIILLNHIET
jgi:hypothetical protein